MTSPNEPLVAEMTPNGLALTPAQMYLEKAKQTQTADAAERDGPANLSSPATKKRKAPIDNPDTDDIISITSSSDKENANSNANINTKKPTTNPPLTSTPNPECESSSESGMDDDDLDDPAYDIPKWSCQQIRAKIRKFVETDKKMKVGAFQDAIGVSSRSYYEFMKQSGTWKGDGSWCFSNAHRFFMRREVLGLDRKEKEEARKEGVRKRAEERKAAAAAKEKEKEKEKEGDGTVTGPVAKKPKTKTSASASSAAMSKKEKEEAFARKYDVSSVTLPGEETSDVQVYDTCDEVRKKIRAVLKDPLMTRAAFCREISKTFPDRAGNKDRTLQGTTLNSFLSKSGPREGRTSLIFYASYVFFEKLRIRDGKEKSEFRKKMERVWRGEGGFDITSSTSTGFFCHVSERVVCDEYGQLRIGR
ncbi:uncharacterized protein DSM5745_02294 [Aspergillus mulundensis]|uniref:DUF7726 domain-containing protein n=1 Tax=Aspergillus mulundensis TaxID=1810919 RepID=A0A3D8SW84_9EURO|nr:hypothetical protein DSM5745_02294 [Aspergillus mulundensis]RDW90519.1 hypothetical protein DSM5745_02294 [Aspergillus mulundensis]